MEAQQCIEGALTALEGAHKRPLNRPRNWPCNRPGPVRRPQGGGNQIRIAVPVGAHDAEGHQHRLDGPPQGFPASMAGRGRRT